MRESKLFSDIALALVGPGDHEGRMNAALAKLGEYLGVSRVYIFRDSPDGASTSNTHEWCAPGVAPQKDSLQDIPYTVIPSWKRLLQADGSIVRSDISSLPDDLRAVLEPQKITSILVLPLFTGAELSGFIGFDQCGPAREWSQIEVDVLTSASAIVSGALVGEAAQERLRSSEENFRRFFDTVDDLIVIGDLQGRMLYANRAVERKLGFSQGELHSMTIAELHPAEKREAAAEILAAMFRRERDSCPLELRRKGGGSLPVETRVWFGQWDGADCIFGISKDLSAEQEALQKFTKLFENNPALMAITDQETGAFTDVNEAFLMRLGYARSEVIGKTSAELSLFVNPGQRRTVGVELAATGRVKNVELQVRRKNGELLDGLFSGEVIDNQGKKYLLTVMVDISDQVELRWRLDAQRRRLRNIIDSARLGTWEWNVKTGATVFNERWAQMVGYTLDELEPVSISTWERLAHPDDLAESGRLLQAHFSGRDDFYSCESRMRHKDGHWVWVLDRGKVVEWSADGAPLMMFGTHSDITELKELEARIREISIRDSLTGLYNRRYIFERLDRIAAEYARRAKSFCVSILDLDHFKGVNDRHGHLAGDHVLREFASLLTSSVRSYDLVGRYGGEEFIVVAVDATAAEATKAVGRLLEKTRNKACEFEGTAIRLTASAGIASSAEFTREEFKVERLVSVADERLYAAKGAGRDRLVGPPEEPALP